MNPPSTATLPQTWQIVDQDPLSVLETQARQPLNVLNQILDSKLDYPFRMQLAGSVLTVLPSSVQKLKSDENSGTTDSFLLVSAPPNNNYTSFATGTIDFSVPSVTSGPLSITFSAVTTGDYIWLGLVADATSGTITGVWGLPNAVSGSATYPTFSSGTPIGIILLQSNGSAFYAPTQQNIILFHGSGNCQLTSSALDSARVIANSTPNTTFLINSGNLYPMPDVLIQIPLPGQSQIDLGSGTYQLAAITANDYQRVLISLSQTGSVQVTQGTEQSTLVAAQSPVNWPAFPAPCTPLAFIDVQDNGTSVPGSIYPIVQSEITDIRSWMGSPVSSSSASVISSVRAGTGITVVQPQAVYISQGGSIDPGRTAGRAYILNASGAVANQAVFFGFATASAISGAAVTIQIGGVLSGFTSLTTGDLYYADPSTPGSITNVIPPIFSNKWSVPVGMSVSPTSLFINPSLAATAAQLVEEFTTTITSASPITLTVTSTTLQQFTGTTPQIVSLPSALTLQVGTQYTILNRSTGSVTVKDGSGSTLETMIGSTQANYICSTNGSSAGTWDVSYTYTGTLPVVLGGTSVTSVTTIPTATSFSGWDANKNLSANSFLDAYTTTVTAAGTTTLLVSSTQLQYFTGSTTQTVLLPVTSTLVLGQSFTIVNNSTGKVTIQSSGANTVQIMFPGTQLTATVILTSGTTAASWSASYVYSRVGHVSIGPAGSGADYITTGTSDEMVFANAATDPNLASGGIINILAGTYNFGALINWGKFWYRGIDQNQVTITLFDGTNNAFSGAASLTEFSGITFTNGGVSNSVFYITQSQSAYFHECTTNALVTFSPFNSSTFIFEDCSIGSIGSIFYLNSTGTFYFRDSIVNCTIEYENSSAKVYGSNTNFVGGFDCYNSNNFNQAMILQGCNIASFSQSGGGTWTKTLITGCYVPNSPMPSFITGIFSGNIPDSGSLYDAIVGSSLQVTNGQAGYSSLVTALTGIPSGGKILLLRETTDTETVNINIPCFIEGMGHASQLNGAITVSASDVLIKYLRFGSTLAISSGANNNIITDCWIADITSFTDSGLGNLISLSSEA